MKLTELRVANYMTSTPITVEPEDSLMRALEVIRLRKVRRLPVTIGGKLVGVITAGDLKRAEPSTLTDSQESFDEVMEETQVSRIMVQNPVTTTPETPLVEVAVVLQKTKYGGLPVVTDGHLVGVITDSDLLRALVDILHAAAKTAPPAGGARRLSLPAREDADVVTSSDEYARRFAGDVGRFFLDVQAAVTLSLLRDLPHARVLDVGGGHGQLAGPLLDAGHELTVLGSDPSCEARVRELHGGRARALRRGGPPGAGPARPLLRRRARVSPAAARRALAGARRDARPARAARGDRGLPDAAQRQRRRRSAVRPEAGASSRTRGPSPSSATSRSERAFAASGFRRTARRPQFLFPMALHRATGSAALARGLESSARALGLTGLLGSPVIARFEPRG